MANKLALGLVIGGAVNASLGAAFKDVKNKIKQLEAVGANARVLQNTIGDTMRLRDEWKKAHDSGDKGATGLLRKLEANLSSLKKQGVEVGRLGKAYEALGRTARKAELKAQGHKQIEEGRDGLKSTLGQATAGAAVMAIPTKVSADYGAIIRDISIKAGIAGTPQEAQMSKTIIETSRDSGMARNQVAEVVNSLVGAGMDLSKALDYAPTAAKFVIGQGSDGGETAKMINALGQNARITDPAVMQKALEAIAFQGQAGSFEAADMARWFPELLAGMGKLGITGMDSVTQLGAMLQVQMKTAGGSDEAANNLKNWMEKIGSGDTVKAYADVGIDYQGSMQTGLQNGMSTLESSFALAQKYIAATDPKKAAAMAEATAKIGKETDPEKAKAMMVSLEQALRTGDLFADMQVKGALTAYMQNKDLYDKLKKESASATGILDKNLEERRQTSAQKWAEMAQGMDDSMRAVGDALRPVTDAVADGLASVGRGLSSVSDESPRLVQAVATVAAGFITVRTVVNGVKIGKGLMNLGRGSLMGNPNIPQKVIVTNLPAGGSGLDAGGADSGGKDKKGGKGGRVRRGRPLGDGVKGPAILAAIDAGFKAKDTYDNATTKDEKAEGYGEAVGGFAGTIAGAAAGAAIGSVVPVIGTVVGGLVGAALGNMGGDALGSVLGKAMFGGDEPSTSMPTAGPLMMADAGQNIAPVLGDIAGSFKPPAAPLMLALPAPTAPADGERPANVVVRPDLPRVERQGSAPVPSVVVNAPAAAPTVERSPSVPGVPAPAPLMLLNPPAAPAPSVESAQPLPNTPAPSVGVNAPAASVPAVERSQPAPRVPAPAPLTLLNPPAAPAPSGERAQAVPNTPAPSVVVNTPAAPAPLVERSQSAPRVPAPAPLTLLGPPAASAPSVERAQPVPNTPAPSVVVNAPAAPAPLVERAQPAPRVPAPAPLTLLNPPAAPAPSVERAQPVPNTPAPSIVVNAPAATAPLVERPQPAPRVPSPAPVMLNSSPAARAARPEAPGPVSLSVKVSSPPPAELPAGAVAPSSAPTAFDPSKAMLPEAESRPGDVVRSMAVPKTPKAAQAAAPFLAAVAQKAAPVKVEQKIEISAPLTLTVQGDVKDPAQLVRELRPLLEQQMREITQQLSSRTLYDAAHV
ncbi:phage tail tape measure protein [Pseudomonas mandelii]|uniref:phage tail tape measure protein n=1 Tax=Pseudomonas mandelii TaxID=75612 RepID=UPI002B057036|nr:phage tail tape measure protein [Pseudomonas mandelii]